MRMVRTIALSSLVSPAGDIERGRQAGFYNDVVKFDRPGLIVRFLISRPPN